MLRLRDDDHDDEKYLKKIKTITVILRTNIYVYISFSNELSHKYFVSWWIFEKANYICLMFLVAASILYNIMEKKSLVACL